MSASFRKSSSYNQRTTTEASVRRKLPQRDYILIPLLCAATIILLFVIAEEGTRTFWPTNENFSCYANDSTSVSRGKPNCNARTKIAEGPWVAYHFNECGYRTNASCGPKQPGTVRIVLLGSSVSEGLNVPYEQTFGERTARELSAALGRSVEVENLGFENLSPLHCYRRLNEVLALEPDVVVYAVSPFDVDQKMDPVQLAHRNDSVAMPAQPIAHFQVARLKRIQMAFNDSHTVLMAQHLLFSNTQTYLRLYLAYGDRADYLRQPLSPRWQAKISDFDLILTDMQSRLRKAGVPLVVMTAPSLPQAALLSVDQPPPHTDPFALSRAIGQMSEKQGIWYVDGLVEFSRVPHSDRLFYVVDSHLTGEGHALLARALARKCLDSGIPALLRRRN